MRITKSIAGFSEVNSRTQDFFELKVVSTSSESEKILRCKKECEEIIRRIDNESNGAEKSGFD